MQSFFESFSKYITPDDIIVLAVSGGVDSMVLFDLVRGHHPREKIVIAHFDHSLRGSESDGDREFVRDDSEQKNITFESEKCDISHLAVVGKMSIENAARTYRYDFLFRTAEKHSAKYILTAHHADDRIETGLFNLVRGSKLGGLHALSEISGIMNHESGIIKGNTENTQIPERMTNNEGRVAIFRPLLSISKGEIQDYATEKNIAYREDSTNASIDYQRNYLRHEILPKLETINPEYRKAITSFIDYTLELKSWIDDEVVSFLGGRNEFSAKDFEKKSPFFQKEIIRYLYEGANSGTIGLSEGNIEELRRFVLTANGGTEKKLEKLHLTKKNNLISYQSINSFL